MQTRTITCKHAIVAGGHARSIISHSLIMRFCLDGQNESSKDMRDYRADASTAGRRARDSATQIEFPNGPGLSNKQATGPPIGPVTMPRTDRIVAAACRCNRRRPRRQSDMAAAFGSSCAPSGAPPLPHCAPRRRPTSSSAARGDTAQQLLARRGVPAPWVQPEPPLGLGVGGPPWLAAKVDGTFRQGQRTDYCT